MDVPEILAAALEADPGAKAFYATLPYSSQRPHAG
ncbi:YdeI/OmpD-associated family protein [Arthrobacter sp. NPDC056886]